MQASSRSQPRRGRDQDALDPGEGGRSPTARGSNSYDKESSPGGREASASALRAPPESPLDETEWNSSSDEDYAPESRPPSFRLRPRHRRHGHSTRAAPPSRTLASRWVLRSALAEAIARFGPVSRARHRP